MSQRPVAATIPSMEVPMAHALASRTHRGQRNRFGDAVVDQLERVPRDARALARLHDTWARHRLIRAQRHRGERTP